MIKAITEVNFPSYATLHQATVSLAEMGERSITTQLRIDGDISPEFGVTRSGVFYPMELLFKGERFILDTREPQAAKDNTTRNSLVDLTFTSWVINELKRYYFFEPSTIDAGTVVADKYKASIGLNVEDFVVMVNKVLGYYFGGKVVMSLYLSGQGHYSTDRVYQDIDYTYIWDLMTKFYESFGVRWRIEYNATTDVYTIKAGYPAPEIDDHDFEYGYKGGLLKFERQVQDVDIRNILLGRGGEKNLPYRYFKLQDPQNPEWAADPDAIPELASITFDRLRDINFRWYVRGWMQNSHRDTSWDATHTFPSYTDNDCPPEYLFAFQKGKTDEKFNPVEYVKDDESIADYGERWGAVEDNDDVYPTIHGVSRSPIGRIDETVAVSEIVTDDIEAMSKNAAIETSMNPLVISDQDSTSTQHTLLSETFTIPNGKTGNITYAAPTSDVPDADEGLNYVDTAQTTMVAVNQYTGTEVPISGIPAGTYRLKINLVIHIGASSGKVTGTFGYETIKLTTSEVDADAWKPTFDIWIKNIWNTTKGSGESDVQYSERVWGPILGDRAGNEAKVVFSTGFMSISEDYEFVIVSYPVHDTSKEINGVPSEWRITLRKSDAEFDATGLYIPNATTGGAPVAGDKFFFTGIDMPHMYVELSEEDLNTAKSAQLESTAATNKTWVINLDKVRCNTLEDGEYGQTLADRLSAGAEVWITDPRFTPGTRLKLFVQSITYTWNEPAENAPYIVPDIEVVLSDKVLSTESTIGKMQGDIAMVKEQYARISDVEAAVRSVAEPMFLKKTGESDTSASPTQFASKVTSKGFRQGGVGGAGWGLYRDNTSDMADGEDEAEGDSVIEVDRVIVRKAMEVNSLVVNQIEALGGKEILSAAKIEVTKVIENNASYVCYFNQRQGSVANLFAVNDIAMGQVFSADNTELRYYKMLVTAVGLDNITLAKANRVGSGSPAVGDVIVQYGNTTNTARQYVIIRDVIGGGYERMLSGLSSLSSNGDEYFYAGRQSSNTKVLVGDEVSQAGEFLRWLNGVLEVKGRFTVRKSDGTYQSMASYIDDNNVAYLKEATNEGTLVDGGLVLTSMIQLGQTVNDAYQVRAGMNGIMNSGRTRLGGGVASWFGGPMSDLYDLDTGVTDYAKTLFRFDGSGYLAKGHIYWDENGYGGIPGITWSRPAGAKNDVITIGADVKLEQTGGTDSTVTDLVSSVQNFPNNYVSIATTQTITGKKTFSHADGVTIGGATLKWHPESSAGAGDGYLEIDSALLTLGDQIVQSGTPGGGGGGGVDHLYMLEDVDSNLQSPNTTGTLLFWDGTKWAGSYINSLSDGQMLAWDNANSRWKNVNAPTGSVTSVAGVSPTNGDVTAADLKTALGISALSGYGVATSVLQTDTDKLVTGAAVWAAIDALPEPMIFKGSLGTGGTITTLPAASSANEGWTYKVITAGTYASQTAKIGDLFISNGSAWIWIPSGDEPEGTVTSVGLTLPTGLVLDTVNGSASPITTYGTFKIAFDTGYSIPLTADVTKGVTARGYFDNDGVLPYNHGGTGLTSYAKGDLLYASAANTLAKLAANSTGTKKFLTMTSSVPSWGGIAFGDLPTLYWANVAISNSSSTTTEPTVKSITIGGATLTWVAPVGTTPGYLKINSALLTEGDQIVNSGTPGGGGSGGAGYLYELGDVYSTASYVKRADGSQAQPGDILTYYDNDKKWVASNEFMSNVAKALTVGTTLDSTEGNFIWSTSSLFVTDNDYAGIQISSGADRLQLTVDGNVLYYRQNDSSPLSSSSWYDWKAIATTTDLSSYVKLDPGTAEQTIKSGISSLAKGVINLWRSSGNDYTFLGFSNGTTETYLGGIGFKSQADTNLYHKTPSSDYYKIWDAGNLTPGNYVLKAGDTITGQIHMDGSSSTVPFARNFTTTGNTGWARLLGAIQVDSVNKFWIGAYGQYTAGATDNGINYAYIGCNGHDGVNLRINSSSIKWGDNDILHAGNYTSYYPSTRTLTMGGSNYSVYSTGTTAVNLDTTYVRQDPGATEQTIKSSISSLAKGVINLWRSSGNDYTFLGFSNGTTETYLGGIGFKSQSDKNLYRKDSNNYYKIFDENNFVAGTNYMAPQTTLAGYGIADAIQYNSNIKNLAATNQIGYGYAASGWYVAGPAMSFGTGNYTAQIQSNGSDNILYYRQTVNGTPKAWVTILHSGNYSSYALPLSAGSSYPLTNDLYLTAGMGISAIGAGLLVYHPSTTWTGISSTQWGVGATDSQGVIRSSNSSLLHYTAGGTYTIWDSGNDGANSGLDADLLDGLHGANYLYGRAFSSYDANTIYDIGLWLMGGGSNLPANAPYGTLMTLPYRKASGNTTTDYAAQIYIPTGDYTAAKRGLYWRDSLATTWNTWRRVWDDGNAGTASYDWACKNLSVNGTVTSTGDQVISSDATKKTNLVPITLTAEQIANAPAISFDWKDGHGHSFGSIAQYWKPLVPEAVLGKEGNYTLAYAQLGTVLGINNGKAIFALQKHETEQDKEIRELKDKLFNAENRIKDLENRLKIS